jgi:hypothetical protein
MIIGSYNIYHRIGQASLRIQFGQVKIWIWRNCGGTVTAQKRAV